MNIKIKNQIKENFSTINISILEKIKKRNKIITKKGKMNNRELWDNKIKREFNNIQINKFKLNYNNFIGKKLNTKVLNNIDDFLKKNIKSDFSKEYLIQNSINNTKRKYTRESKYFQKYYLRKGFSNFDKNLKTEQLIDYFVYDNENLIYSERGHLKKENKSIKNLVIDCNNILREKYKIKKRNYCSNTQPINKFLIKEKKFIKTFFDTPKLI